MKKFIAIATGVLLAASVCVFAACNNSADVTEYHYQEVDLTNESQKKALVDEIAEKVNLFNLFGDTTAKNYSFGFASEAGVKLEVSAGAQNVALPNLDNAVDLEAALSFETNSSAKAKYSSSGIALEGESSIAASLTASDELYGLLAYYTKLDADSVTAIKAAVSNINYSFKEYIDNDYVYLEYPKELLDLIPDSLLQGVSLPEGGKIKIALDSYGSGNNTSYYALPEASTYASAPQFDPMKELVKAYAAQALDFLYECDVKIETSSDDGFAIKLSANSAAIFKLVGQLGSENNDVLATIEEYASFKSLDVVVYFSVDKSGVFKQLSVGVEADADVTVNLANLIGEGMPTITGSAKISLNLSLKKYTGKVKVPSTDNSYVDVSALLNSAE